MNYRMYTDKEMNEANMSMAQNIAMEDDVEMPAVNRENMYEMPMYGTMQMDDLDDMSDMDNMMPMNEAGYMCNMDNIMPCCMMSNMGVMPYMVELEEDEEDEKCDDDVEDIVKKIEKHHPEILTVLSAYGMQYNTARKVIARIVRLTLKHK